LVYELIHKFTHTIEMPWILPGVPPTGKRVEIAVIVVVQFKEEKSPVSGFIGTKPRYWLRSA
jgi:carboxymethylenebutenolidase